MVVLVGGLCLYGFSSNAKAAELGRLMFACAMLALCIVIFAPLAAKFFH